MTTAQSFKHSSTRQLPISLERERILNVHQAAELYGISVVTFRRQYWAGKLPKAIRVSDRRLGWRSGELLDHLAGRCGSTSPGNTSVTVIVGGR